MSRNSYSLGAALVLERKKRNIPLEEISKITNITIKSLTALENNEFQCLPGEFYLRCYIKSYLKAIGCDENIFFHAHQGSVEVLRLGIKAKKIAHFSKLRYSRFKKRKVFFSSFFLFVLVSVAFLFLFLRQDTIPQPSLYMQAIDIPPVPITKANDFSIDYWPVRVAIDFLDKCWIRVQRGQQESQQKAIEQVYQKGDRLEINGYALHFFIGNPSVIRFYLNNREVTTFKNISQAKKIIITPKNVNEILETCYNLN